MDLALNNLQRLICQKTQTNKQIETKVIKKETSTHHDTKYK